MGIAAGVDRVQQLDVRVQPGRSVRPGSPWPRPRVWRRCTESIRVLQECSCVSGGVSCPEQAESAIDDWYDVDVLTEDRDEPSSDVV